MKKTPLYSASRSRRSRVEASSPQPSASVTSQPRAAAPGQALRRQQFQTPTGVSPVQTRSNPPIPPHDGEAPRTGWRARVGASIRRRERLLTLLGAGLIALAAVVGVEQWREPPVRLTQKDIDGAVMHTLANRTMPSEAVRAYDKIRGSVVLVRGLEPGADEDTPPEVAAKKDAQSDAHQGPGDKTSGVGTGVVIVDKGTILTNLHVVAGADRIRVVFADGTESPARIVALRPEHDLAVLQATQVPENLPAATLRSTTDLQQGESVIAVGFPFGIGPSVSHGVVSGMKREFQSREGKSRLTNLIQFDAAANPGNSGGPLVTMDGSVVGIVTGILNPTEQRVFIGIGFAVPIENAASAVGSSPF